MATSAERKLEASRKKNRERQRRYRAKKKVEKADEVKVPTKTKSVAMDTLGYPGRRSRTMFAVIDDPVLVEFRGTRLARTLERMMLDPIVSGAIDSMTYLLSAADWTIVPGDEEDERSRELAERIQENLDGMYPGWQATVADAAECFLWGWHTAEVLFKRFDDGFIGWGSFMPIMQRTIQEWKIDEEGRLTGVYQQPEDAVGRWLPAWKLLHFRSKPAAGRPEGKSLARNSYLAWTDKQELRRIVKTGIRRDFTGTADMQVPAKILSPNATDEEKSLKDEAESLVRDFEQDERQGIMRPAEEDEKGNPTGWKFGLVQSPGTRQVPLVDVWNVYDRQIALGLLSDEMLLGADKTGSYALMKEKTKWKARAIGAFLDHVAEFMNQVAVPVLVDFNPTYKNVKPPYFNHGDIEQLALDELSEYFSKLGASGFIRPNEEVEKYLLRRVAAPEEAGEEEV